MDKKLSDMTLEEVWQLFPVTLTAHDPQWQVWYSDEAVNLKKLIAPRDCKIHHIGSTAVKTIFAKPTVDILVELRDKESLRAVADILCADGYIEMSSDATRISLNKGYTERGYAERVFHIHLRLDGDRDEIFFRDYLIAHPDVAARYERLKLDLQQKFKYDRDGYTAAKHDFISKATAAAKAGFAQCERAHDRTDVF